MTNQSPSLAIIGGTGVYNMSSLADVEAIHVPTPYGDPSDAIWIGSLNGMRVAFLARHGHGHRLLPSEVPFRANIWALKSLGVERIIAVSACGSMKEIYRPGDIVIPDQVFDRTKWRPATFFGEGLVAHVAFAHPFCETLRHTLGRAAQLAAASVHIGGTYLIIEGPRFSSRGESLIYRQWGIDIIGMTVLPEAQLAREAEMCYAVIAHVTDYDCWREADEGVNVELVVRTLQQNARTVERTVGKAIELLTSEAKPRDCECARALQNAMLTPVDRIPENVKERLRPIIGRYL